MYRSASRSKWKEVLGFDDGLSDSTSPTISPTVTTFNNSYKQSSPSPPPRATYPRLPRDITLFSTNTLDLVLRPSSLSPSSTPPNTPPPTQPTLFYLTIQKDPDSTTSTARPDILLHSGPSKTHPIISFAKYHTVTQVTDITLCPPSPPPHPPQSTYFPPTNFSFPNPRHQSHQYKQSLPRSTTEGEIPKPRFKNERLCPTGGIFTPVKYSFFHTLPLNTVRERFEWKNSNSVLVRAFEGGLGINTKRSRGGKEGAGGLKLVRVSTGDVLAVFVGFGEDDGGFGERSERVVGMFRFLGVAVGGLGGEFEVLALMSVLSVVERLRRCREGEGGFSPP